MNLFVSSQRHQSASLDRFGSRLIVRGLLFLAVVCFIALPISAQVSSASVPSAPLPNLPQLKATLSDAADSSARNAVSIVPAGDISLYTVVDLALRNSKAVHVAEAQQQIARGAWKETRDAYIPNLALGSGLGYSYGFPLGTPTIFNVTSTSLLYSFSQHDYIRSTAAAMKAAALSLKSTRQQVILDATLNYIDLAKTIDQIAALNQATADTDKLLNVMADRLQAGLETNIQMTRARLTRAQIALRTIQMGDHAGELRQRLSNLTGLEASLIAPVSSSIPTLPDLDFPALLRADPKTPSLLAAEATADSKMFAARGDEKQNYRPTIQLASQYALFSTFNNYTQYYQPNSFQANNFGIGIQAVWPLFDRLRRDKANESKADAVRARQQAELDHIQSNEGNLTLWHNLRELEAQAQVVELLQQLSQDTLAATVTQMNHGSADTRGAPITPQQAEQQRIDERTSYVDLEDAQFNVTKVKLDLLNVVGGLEDWAKEGAQATVLPQAPQTVPAQ
jgi:outer membrane protein TolC